MTDRLHYTCHFLLARTPIRPFANWKFTQIGRYYLSAHPDLELNRLSDLKKTIVILGEIYDSENPYKGNAEILQDIMVSVESLEDLVSRLKLYAGCFAILFNNNGSTIALHDARGLREIYYCAEANQIICGSQPHLIAKFSSPEIKPTNDIDLLDFFHNYLWDSRWVGDETYFGGVKHLLPNHYFDIEKLKARRYWPMEFIQRLGVDEAVEKSSAFLRGMVGAIIHRHQVMMGMTAGTDSRTLLAASRGLQNKIYYFINNHDFSYDNTDILVPKDILGRIGVPFHVHDVKEEVDKEFRQAFFNNTFLAAERLLPSIYDLFVRNKREKVLILGVSEIGRTFYGKAPKHLTGYRMAYRLKYKNSRYAIKQCEQVASEIEVTGKKLGINPMALLYWEQRLGNWGAVRNSESLLAIEKIDPFNSHLLYEIFLGVDEKYRNYQEAPCIFFKELIRAMWPELLEWPINPPTTKKDKLQSFLVKLGVYEPLLELKYQVSYLKHIIGARH